MRRSATSPRRLSDPGRSSSRGTRDGLIQDAAVKEFADALVKAGQRVGYVQVGGAGHADWKPDEATKATFAKYGVYFGAEEPGIAAPESRPAESTSLALMDTDFADSGLLVRPEVPRISVSVRQVAALLPRFFQTAPRGLAQR